MTRMVSFAVLLGLVVLFGLLSLRVMASFLLPLLLAAMLVVIFGPLHRWLRDRFRLAEWLAAGLTTLVVLVIVLNYLLATWLLPALDTGYLADSKFGDTSIGKVRGLWAVTVALATAIALLMWLQRERLPRMTQTLEQGAGSSVMPLLNTASQVGFGAVIASLAGFAVLRDAVLTIAPDNPLVSVSIAVNLLAGITGSASGGMSIALQTLGETWLAMGQAAGIAPELLHRVTAIATGGLDALPHNGAVITLLGICG
jgi:H+/gluconate symporter-like permease